MIDINAILNISSNTRDNNCKVNEILLQIVMPNYLLLESKTNY